MFHATGRRNKAELCVKKNSLYIVGFKSDMLSWRSVKLRSALKFVSYRKLCHKSTGVHSLSNVKRNGIKIFLLCNQWLKIRHNFQTAPSSKDLLKFLLKPVLLHNFAIVNKELNGVHWRNIMLYWWVGYNKTPCLVIKLSDWSSR